MENKNLVGFLAAVLLYKSAIDDGCIDLFIDGLHVMAEALNLDQEIIHQAIRIYDKHKASFFKEFYENKYTMNTLFEKAVERVEKDLGITIYLP